MSPFSKYFHQLRMSFGIRQVELAELLGYEQSYISALEIGTKGPPTPEFIERLIEVLSLSEEQREKLLETVEASQRKLVIPSDVPEDIYWLVQDLRRHLNTLRPAEINIIREIIKLKDSPTPNLQMPVRRVRSRQKEGAKM
ncbi:transcriptional regulator [Chromobacterium violaceum]|uniref:helix-turn-helix domain-containing protein n=1 Tax=Chromobacterium violaceum TaxID=536 RepID=UPI00065312EB|nr:helix-turn-helix transcriptional regulator [Chromobacterium violaceum]KMN48635.1 transcriptional regulator [Chromobacterium violaceum]KMN87730.1 transcriptional regulator [Chromobacterium violaceum]KMN88839.1 transcriptional regulator [Chromobacterium violaceum]KMO05333.1 transcriptional regulator [Chromobacterium violaceum]